MALLDCKESSTHIHIVMEYCPMGDLSLFIRKRDSLARHPDFLDIFRRYPNPRAGGLHEVLVRHFLQQLASALAFLRQKDLMHRDVKPQNLLIDPSPRFLAGAAREGGPSQPFAPSASAHVPLVGLDSLPMLKLADFGFARWLPTTTLAETLCGSPLYMAPEILRYEKYDAKADLWSVGTVAYEMATGKPPFRATNHIDLLRKIEQAQDVVRFPEEPRSSRDLKTLIRGLLKRNPIERMGFDDFFDNTVIKDDIPDLVAEDRPEARQPEAPTPASKEVIAESSREPRRTSATKGPEPPEPGEKFVDAVDFVKQPAARRPSVNHTASAPPNQTAQVRRKPSSLSSARTPPKDMPPPTIPASQARRKESYSSNHPRTAADERAAIQAAAAAQEAREAQERAAQDVAFERDYVVVEKRAVEVNAFADELAASPRIHGGATHAHPTHDSNSLRQQQQQDALKRRNTTPNVSPQGVGNNPSGGTQVAPQRALQLTTGKRPEHMRQASHERRLRSGISTSSAISKAINLASGRLFNFGLSPPLGLTGRSGPSPPAYSPYPTYPTAGAGAGPPLLEDAARGPSPAAAAPPTDDDARAILAIEETAHRSDVVYGFAEVKYKQLLPLAPSVANPHAAAGGLGPPLPLLPTDDPGTDDRPAAAEDAEDGLTVHAVVALSEEALVLYVKALALLARAMDVAHAWWARRGGAPLLLDPHASSAPGSGAGADAKPLRPQPVPAALPAAAAAGARINRVVQWVRDRFNEVLEKAELVRRRLLAAQAGLPPDHPSHPGQRSAVASRSGAGSRSSTVSGGTGGGSSGADFLRLTPGVSAEKLLWARALEMGRSAAVNELVCEDLAGCEIAYVTAVRMLEAVLDGEGEGRDKGAVEGGEGREEGDEGDDLVTAEDRASMQEGAFSAPHRDGRYCADGARVVVKEFRRRLHALRKKIQVRRERDTAAAAATPMPKSRPLSGTPAEVSQR